MQAVAFEPCTEPQVVRRVPQQNQFLHGQLARLQRSSPRVFDRENSLKCFNLRMDNIRGKRLQFDRSLDASLDCSGTPLGSCEIS